MPSEKSSSDGRQAPAAKGRGRLFYPTLYLKNIKRFWPMWVIYLVIWLFLMPLNILSSNRYYSNGDWPSNYILNMLSPGIILSVLFGLFSAMAVFSYLYNAKAAGMLHALPVTREGLFLTNWLSGFSFLLVPNAVVAVLTLAAQLLIGRVALWPLFLWFLCISLIGLFFYSFASFCAMFTGSLVALPVFYGILNFLATGLAYLLQTMASEFLFGFTSTQGLQTAASWLTPSLKLTTEVYSMVGQNGGAGPLHGFIYILFYALVGVVLSVLSLLVYRRRHLESAGDIVSVGWVRPVFKYGVAFCCAIVFGVYLFSFLFGSLPDNAWGLLAFMLLCGLAGYFIAEMLLRKSFRIFTRSWKGAGCFALALILCCCALEFDVTGFERRVPAPASLRAATLSQISSAPYDRGANVSFFLTDPGDIAAVTQLHTAITREKETLERKARSYNTTVSEVLGGIEIETETWKDVYLEYETLSGSFISRAYTIPVTAELLADPSSPAALLNEILNRPELVEQSYFRNLPENAELVRASVNTYDTAAGGFNDSKNGDENLSALLDAVHSDIAAGRLGRRYLLENEERYQNCYYNDLTLTFYYTYIRDDGTRDSNTVDVCITLQTTAADTLRELRRLGILDEDHVLLTHAEMQQRDQPYMDYSIQEDVPADEALQIYNRHTS